MFIRERAVEYALKWANDRNSNYYDFTFLGGDCTNFISQCMFYGGFKMNYNLNGWYYNSLNSRAPAWTGVNEFWNFSINNASNYGVKLKPCNLSEVEIADVIQLYNGIRYYHNLIVSEVYPEIKVCAHDANAKNLPLRYYNFTSLRCGKILPY